MNDGTEIEILPDCNVAVIKGDGSISSWVQSVRRLDYDRNFLDFITPYIKKDGLALDIGANIGSHTFEYLKHASGVIAFEPNPAALACLKHNCPRAILHNVALGDKFCRRYWTRIFPNCGASYLSDEFSPGCLVVPVRTLDSFNIPDKIGYIKIDAEGEETVILKGARETILRNKPNMCLEVNNSALERTHTSPEELYALLKEYGYVTQKVPMTDNGNQVDVIATPS